MSETVTLPRTEYEALIERLEDLEDAIEVAKFRADEQTRGIEAVRADLASIRFGSGANTVV
ncbi:MAG: hypothetical protein QOF22_2488 [Bradyrhizobium sp.]|jgi:hypothetical protein|nr:hypothetical protein [Bradyrhizobium sp.]